MDDNRFCLFWLCSMWLEIDLRVILKREVESCDCFFFAFFKFAVCKFYSIKGSHSLCLFVV